MNRTVFPARFFYPYGSVERWRRYEQFPEAYAVHHWTLNDLTTLRWQMKSMLTQNIPCLTVVLHPVESYDELRLRWVLEGLCLQTVTNFEIVAIGGVGVSCIEKMCSEYAHKLNIRIIYPEKKSDKHVNAASMRNIALEWARSNRILFLNADCLPDPDVVETHAQEGARHILLYGYRRLYPQNKLFEFRDAVDYGGIFINVLSDNNDLYVAPAALRWKEANAFLFSVPVMFAKEIGGFDEKLVEGEVTDIAERLSHSGCPSVPCLCDARVTQMGYRGNAIANNGVASPVALQANGKRGAMAADPQRIKAND